MRRLAVVLAAILLLGACTKSKAPPLVGDFSVTRLSDRVYVIHGPVDAPNRQNQGFTNNPAFVLTKAGVVVVDPGASVQIGEMVLHKIAGVTHDPVVAVFDTALPGDHWLGNQAIKTAYPKAVIYAHRSLVARAANDGPEAVTRLDHLTEGAVRGTKPVAPDLDVQNEDTLRIGDRHFRIYHNDAAAHDPGIAIQAVEDQTVFLGGAACAGCVVPLADGDIAGRIALLDAVAASGATHFVPGHGASGGSDIVAHYREYLLTLGSTLKKCRDDGLTEKEALPKVMVALGRFRGWKELDAGLETQVHRVYAHLAGGAP
jgi:glyoxylase-like metal-dependent hydrolase (beta-lactamase superfamily II)